MDQIDLPKGLGRRVEAGATLIEVLIAVVVLAIGLLGLAGLQMSSMQSNYSAYQRSQATWLAYDMVDRMRVNREAALAGDYDSGFPSPALACDPALVSSGSLSQRDLAEWRNNVACLLPQGNASVARNGRVFTVSVRWDDSRGAPGGANDSELTFVFRTEL